MDKLVLKKEQFFRPVILLLILSLLLYIPIFYVTKPLVISMEKKFGNNNISNHDLRYPRQTTDIPVQQRSTGKSGVVITFDDHNIDQWYSARQLFKKYKAKATFFIDHFNQLNNDSIDKLIILKNDGHEIGCHSLNHKNAVEFVKQYSINDYLEKEIIPSIEYMKEKGFQPDGFAYPFGAHSNALDDALLKYFKYLRSTTYTNEHIRIKDLNKVFFKDTVHKIFWGVGIDENYGNSLEEIMEGLKRAKDNNEIMILYGHSMSNKVGNYITRRTTLEEILKFAHDNGINFFTLSELIDE